MTLAVIFQQGIGQIQAAVKPYQFVFGAGF